MLKSVFSDVSLGSGEYGEGEARKGERMGRREKEGGGGMDRRRVWKVEGWEG